jgi:hypothetical protein
MKLHRVIGETVRLEKALDFGWVETPARRRAKIPDFVDFRRSRPGGLQGVKF